MNSPEVLGNQRGQGVHHVADGEGAGANHGDDADLPQLVGEDAKYRREDHLREGVGGYDKPVESELISHVGVELEMGGFFVFLVEGFSLRGHIWLTDGLRI